MNGEQSAFSADVPAPFAAGPPGNSPIAAVTDVVLVTNDAAVRNEDLGTHPPILMPEFPRGPGQPARDPDPIPLGRNAELVRFEGAEAERIMNACSARGHHFSPVRQYGQRYTFRRPVERHEWERRTYGWDQDGVLSDVLQMSRLVLDNGWSTEYAARVFVHEDGQEQIMPLPNRLSIYRLQPLRDWLTAIEATELRELLAVYWEVKDDLPARVGRALWNAEYMCTVRWLDIRVPLLVIAFEGLIGTSQSLVRRQFRERVPRVAAEVGADCITPEMCNNLYAARSRWAHGGHIALRATTPRQPEPDPEADDSGSATDDVVSEIARFQEALRRTVRRCIEDPEFAAVFSDDASVRARWPVTL